MTNKLYPSNIAITYHEGKSIGILGNYATFAAVRAALIGLVDQCKGAYIKVSILITYPDGLQVATRADVDENADDKGTDVGGNLARQWRMNAGVYRPRHWSEEQQKEYLKLIKPEKQAEHKRLLATYATEDPDPGTVLAPVGETTMEARIEQLFDAITASYRAWITMMQFSNIDQKVTAFRASCRADYGKVYIKLVKDGSIAGYIVATHDHKSFAYGDLLKGDAKKPHTNFARGNLFKQFSVNMNGIG